METTDSVEGPPNYQQNKSSNNNNGGDGEATVQIRCCLDEDLKLFRITKASGKALSSGGFGFSIPRPKEEASKIAAPTLTKVDGDVEPPGNSEKNKTQTGGIKEYLFIEEAFFLHERGLLLCQDPRNENGNLDTSQFLQLLPQMNLRLPVYLVYAHLRSQDFRVLRHSPGRLKLLRRQKELKSMPREEISFCWQEAVDLRHQVRLSIANASPPSIPSDGGLTIAWDAYQPNSQFAKTHPGAPDFCVAVTYYNEPHVSFTQLEDLVLNESDGIPIKLASVSDSGTVMMFGVTNVGVPTMGTEE